MKERKADPGQKKTLQERIKPRTILNFLILGLCFGVIHGTVKAFLIVYPNQYFHQKMHRLIWLEFAQNINNSLVWGMTLSILAYMFFIALSLIPLKRILQILKLHHIQAKKYRALFVGLLLVAVLTYAILIIAKRSFVVFYASQFALILAFILLLVFLFRLRKTKRGFSAIKVRPISVDISPVIQRVGIIFLFIALSTNAVVIGQNFFNPNSGPNVVLLVMDTLRADHLGCYGYSRPTSPHIDEFAKDSLLFERVLSNSPWTKPSMGSLFTSKYPSSHRAFYWSDNLDEASLTLAELLKNLKYFTIAFQTNPILSKDHNFDQGFMQFEDISHEKAESVVSKFSRWLENHDSGRSFFAYLHFMDPHLPYEAPASFQALFEPEPLESELTGKEDFSIIREAIGGDLTDDDKQHVTNLYDAEIRYLDTYFEKIISSLEREGLLDNTVIVLTSDHGEELWDHGSFEHGHTLYKELLHVPLIIGHIKAIPPRSISSLVHLMDLLPTVLHLAGGEIMTDVTGTNLIPSAGKGKAASEVIFFEGLLYGTEKKGLIKGGWKLIEDTGEKHPKALQLFGTETNSNSSKNSQKFELYNTTDDFHDRDNVIDRFPHIASELKKLLQRMKIKTLDYSTSNKSDEQKKLEDLKSLGYIK